ncbi:MAG: Uma2 family endonuclease [Gemmatimonadaceae bacterium]
MPLPQHTDWTVELLHELPDDGNRYEILNGVLLVSPAPVWRHQRAIRELFVLLAPYVAGLGLEVLMAPAAVTWSRHTELQPDLLVVPLVNGRPAERFEDVGVLELAVEVLSPSSLRTDRFTKRREYQKQGVAEYWVVDAAQRSFERWRPRDEEPEILFDALSWQPRADSAPLVLDLVRYFKAVSGDR